MKGGRGRGSQHGCGGGERQRGRGAGGGVYVHLYLKIPSRVIEAFLPFSFPHMEAPTRRVHHGRRRADREVPCSHLGDDDLWWEGALELSLRPLGMGADGIGESEVF